VTVHHVYILGCADGSFYVDHTTDLSTREAVDNDGRGARFTPLRRPVRLLFSETCASLDDAIRRERQIKRWSHAKKHALIAHDYPRLKKA
jgi:putative endonuclease